MDDPADGRLFGKNTRAAIENFDVSGEPVAEAIIVALAHVKAAAALANARHGAAGVHEEMAGAIVAAADEVIAGAHRDQFPVDVFQTGSGTSTNMNVNEVIATRASALSGLAVHPNDHVNASQSTNDTFPTALRVAVLTRSGASLEPSLQLLERELALKAEEFAAVVKAGRTHLMDATPVTLGQEAGGWRAQIAEARQRFADVRGRVSALPLGGTATGNGLNAPPGFAAAAIAVLAERTGLELREAPDHFAVQGAQDALVEMSAQLRGAAVALFKVANDIRWLASGPRTGLAEVRLPELQPGSSIMPGKVNPVICEVVLQVAAQVMGNDATVAFAGTQGNLELNVFLPVIGRNVLSSVELLAGAARSLASKVVAPMEADIDRCRSNAEATPALATALNPLIGYDAATRVVRRATETGRSIIDVVVEEGLLDAALAAEVLDVTKMALGTVEARLGTFDDTGRTSRDC